MMYGSVLPFGAGAGPLFITAITPIAAIMAHVPDMAATAIGITAWRRPVWPDCAQVVRDLNTLTVGHQAPANDRNILRNDLMALSQGGMRPPSGSVQQLSQNLINYLPQRSTAGAFEHGTAGASTWKR